MNSKKKARVSIHGNISSGHVSSSSQNEPQKHNVLTGCRRVGLTRKRNKSLGVTSNTIDSSQNKNVFIEEDLKQITESTNSSEINNENIEVNNLDIKIKKQKKRKLEENDIVTINSPVSQVTNKEENNENIIVNKSKTIVKNKIIKQKKHKLQEDDIPVIDSPRPQEPANSGNKTNYTIPVSINLTRCNLNALKIKIVSPKKNIQENKENRPTIENTDENIVESTTNLDILENQTPNTTLKSNVNNNLEENSDSDFYPNVTRRKKKKVLTSKQRNSSQSSSSQQKEIISSTNNNSRYSDSEDDFLPTPVLQKRKSSIKVEYGVKSEKDEKKPRKKLKLSQNEDDLNKTGHIRISEHKSYTTIHNGNVVSYVKSFDNDNFKVMEGDDNHILPPVRQLVMPKQTMILERYDYMPKSRDSENNTQILNETPSMFADIMNDMEAAEQDLKESQEKERIYQNIVNEKIKKELEIKSNEINKKLPTLEEPGPSGLQNISSNTDSSDISTSDSSSSDTESTNKELTDLRNLGLQTMTAEKLTEIKDALQATIKKKQERLESLQRIQVYKETHNLEELQSVTLQIKRGCQRALVDLIASLKEQSNANFTMATLLEYMKIPNELVGYNEEEDSFT